MGDGGGSAVISFYQHNDGTDAPNIDFYKSRGTAASPTAAANGDTIAGILTRPYDGSSYQQTANIKSKVAGNVSSGVVPANIVFATSETDTSGLSERMIVSSSGDVQVYNPLRVSGSYSTVANMPKVSIGVPNSKMVFDVEYDFSTIGPFSQLAVGEAGGDKMRVSNFKTNVNVVGELVAFNGTQWTNINAGNTANSKRLLGMALSTDGGSDEGLVLTKGFMRIPNSLITNADSTPATDQGSILYIDESSSGKYSFNKPSGSGDIIRALGYCLQYDSSSTDYFVYFNPDLYWEAAS